MGGVSAPKRGPAKFLVGLFPSEKASRKFWWDFRRRKKLPQNFGGTSAAGKSPTKILADTFPPGNNPTKTCVAAVLEAEFPPVWWAVRPTIYMFCTVKNESESEILSKDSFGNALAARCTSETGRPVVGPYRR